jgi:calcineurin-like phosphoesterase family protein
MGYSGDAKADFMTHYLIEFRFFGESKHEIKRLIRELQSTFRLWRRHRAIPHITLVGPLSTRDEGRLISDFEELCTNQPIMNFKVKGYGTFDDSRVVFINIEPDEALDKFRWKLSKRLKDYCRLDSHDLNIDFKFHATLAMHLRQDKFDEVREHIQTRPKPEFPHCVMRVTLLRGQKILREYDFFLERLLSRREAKSRRLLSESFCRLEEYLRENKIDTDIDLFAPIEEVDVGTTDRVFFISDTHFDHVNIIRYCNRPFNSVREMNDILVNNWNRTVGKNDVVFFLGDLVVGRRSRPPDYWLPKLRGNIVFIKGRSRHHVDRARGINFYDRLILNHEGQKFLLVHNPKDVPSDWKDWVIHGHTHNNNPEYPLINRKNKTINVSVELLDYKPLSMDGLLKLIREK